MTSRNRQRNQAHPAEADPIGKGRHQVDGDWGKAKTFFDSELYAVLVAWIDDAIAHSNVKPSPIPTPIDLRQFSDEAGLTETQYEALAMTVEGFSTREVAAFLEVSQTAVQRRMIRLRERIQRFMEAKSASEEVGGTQNPPTRFRGGYA